MDIQNSLKIVGLFFLGTYAVFHTIYWIKTYNFHKALKSVDLELYESIRMKWSGNKPFYNFIFKKGFNKLKDKNLLKKCKELYFFGWVGQWGFNLGVLFCVIYLIAIYS